eukprot:9473920-Pyramimonas_sp.AAC.2
MVVHLTTNTQGEQLTEHSPWSSSPYIPAVGTNHERGERIYPQWGPITKGEREYTRSGHISAMHDLSHLDESVVLARASEF